ncbi:MAG: ParB/RepB/Spo0J family partition protein [Chromatiaceae bacterium]|nr:ParB/RepB/Spo0J family partition protein [Chromatiaceae bacterium]
MAKTSKGKSLIGSILSGDASSAQNSSSNVEEGGDKQTILQHRAERMHGDARKSDRRTKVISTIAVDPALCRIQQRPNRIYELLDERNCADLVASIETHGQETPAIARETGDKEKPFEIVVGRRRHWVASHLKRDLIVELRVMTDEQAFLVSEAENEGRRDLSDYEKALDWADALENFYAGKVDRLAVAINKPRETVYAFLRLAALDKRIVDAYESVLEIKRAHAEKYTAILKDRAKGRLLLEKADAIKERKGAGQPLDGAAVFKALIAASTKAKKAGGLLLDEAYVDSNKRPAFKISRSARGGFVIALDKHCKCSKEELKRLIGEAIDTHVA